MTFKGAGFCTNVACLAYMRSQFYMGSEESYSCKLCHNLGFLERTHTLVEGWGLCKTVVVHFRFDPLFRTYKMQAMVTDEGLPDSNTKVVHLYHPLINVDKSALAIAEKAMADLATGHNGITIDLSGDRKLFDEALSKLDKSLRNSKHLKADLGSNFVSLEDTHDLRT